MPAMTMMSDYTASAAVANLAPGATTQLTHDIYTKTKLPQAKQIASIVPMPDATAAAISACVVSASDNNSVTIKNLGAANANCLVYVQGVHSIQQ